MPTTPENLDELTLAAASSRLSAAGTERELVDLIAELEVLQRAAVAVQAEVIAELFSRVRAADRERGVPADRCGASVAPEVALARRLSPRKGGRFVGSANALVHEMPRTMTALRSGRIDEWTVTGIVRETSCLSVEDRGRVDEALEKEFRRKGVPGSRIIGSAKAVAQQLDPAAAVARIARAERERHVSVRPAPEGMTWVCGLVPMRDGVAVNAALLRAARCRETGDDRRDAQVMADVFVERITGRNPVSVSVPVAVELLMTEESLMRDGDQSVSVVGMGPMPARHARAMVADAAERDQAWVRRLYTTPDGERLVAMDSDQRRFPKGLAHFLRLRDQRCATPFCDAPVQHADHVTPHREGGPTSEANGQGLCAHCNYTKEISGFSVRRDPESGETTWRTPSGTRYHRSPPDALGHVTLPGGSGYFEVVNVRYLPVPRAA